MTPKQAAELKDYMDSCPHSREAAMIDAATITEAEVEGAVDDLVRTVQVAWDNDGGVEVLRAMIRGALAGSPLGSKLPWKEG